MGLSRRDFIKASAACAALSMAGLPSEAVADTQVSYGRAQCRFCGVGCTVLAGVKGSKVVAAKWIEYSGINHTRSADKILTG